MTDCERDRRELRKQLKALVVATQRVSEAADRVMKGADKPGHGERMAVVLNALDMASDVAARYGLGMSFKQIANAREKLKAAPMGERLTPRDEKA